MPRLVLDIYHGERGIDLGEWMRRHGLWGVIVKCGGSDDDYWNRFEETTWVEQVTQAHALGLHVGAYYYSDALTVDDALKDARHCVEKCMRGMTIDMPVYLDIEEPAQLRLNMRQLTDVVTTWCDYVRAAGYQVGVYAGYEAYRNMHFGEIRGYSLWVASWQTSWPMWASAMDLWQEGSMRLDGSRYHKEGEVDGPGKVDLDWASDEFVARIEGGGKMPGNLFNPAEEMAELHAWMCTDPAFGYNIDTPGGNKPTGVRRHTTKSGRTYEIMGGDYSCSTSIITVTKAVFARTKYARAFDGATYTGDMRRAYVSSGLWAAVWQPAVRGDIYLNEGVHTAMCQDGGNDGVYGADTLSEFNRSEDPSDRYHGRSGDQDGYESVIRGFYDDNWNVILHYVGGLIEDLMWDGEDGDDTEVTPMGKLVMYYSEADKRNMLWDGSFDHVPYHLSTVEKKAVEMLYGVKLQKIPNEQAQAILDGCMARKAWNKEYDAQALRNATRDAILEGLR